MLDRLDVEAYIFQLLAIDAQSDGSDETDKALREHCDALRNESTTTLADQPPVGVEPEHLELAQRLAPLLHVGLDGNPRRVKRFLNEMSQREHLARARGIDVDRAAVAKLMVLEQVHPNEFGRILRWVRSDELEARLASIEDDEDAAGLLADWHRMAPNIDADTVRRYVLLAASLRGEVVAMHALPEHLREMASRLMSSNETRRDSTLRRVSGMVTEDAIHLGDAGPDDGADSQDAPDANGSNADGSQEPDGPPVPPLPAAVLGRIARALQSGADGPGGGAGAGLPGSTGTGRASAGSTGFSRSAGRAGGRAVAGIAAYQRRDAGALAEVGLSLADLEALDDNWDRAVEIADAATSGDHDSASDEDLRWATVQTAAWAMDQEQPNDVRDLVAQFVADYVYRKVSYEIGHKLRDGSGDGADTETSERSLRASIRICVHSEIASEYPEPHSAAELSHLVARVCDEILEVWSIPQ